jgi:hypothetical protein
MLVDLHLDGRLPLDRFVSETISLGDVEKAFGRWGVARYCAASFSSDGGSVSSGGGSATGRPGVTSPSVR